jgi:hypothetical protein
MSSDHATENAERIVRTSEAQRVGSAAGAIAGHNDTAANKLLAIAAIARQLANDALAQDAGLAAERVAEGRFYVACVGQFKRGKSALLNALVGQTILPTGVVPVTAVPTILRFGESPRARMRSLDGNWSNIALNEIEQYVSEEKNPENSKRVALLEVFLPSSLLVDGMCLVDTPGLGSVFPGNTAATHSFLPHVDAAIVVIGSDPPISGDELMLVETVSKQVSDIVFVLNKADRANQDERTAAVSFARKLLEPKLRRPIPQIFEVSALEQLSQKANQRDWGVFVRSLQHLVDQSGHRLVREASIRSLCRFSHQLLAAVREERDALTRPFEESEARLGHIREIVLQAEQSLHDLGFLMSGEQSRLSRTFSDRRDAFLKLLQPTAHDELTAALKSLPRASGPVYRRHALQTAQQVAHRHIMPWLNSERETAEQSYREATGRFTKLANDFLSRTRNIGGVEVGTLPRELTAATGFRTRPEFQFYDFVHVARPASPARYLADAALGAAGAYRTIDASAHEFLDRLLETNSERVRNDLENKVAESRRQLEAEIRTLLRQLTDAAERALVRARAAHAAGSEAVQSALHRLAQMESEISQLSRADTEQP